MPPLSPGGGEARAGRGRGARRRAAEGLGRGYAGRGGGSRPPRGRGGSRRGAAPAPLPLPAASAGAAGGRRSRGGQRRRVSAAAGGAEAGGRASPGCGQLTGPPHPGAALLRRGPAGAEAEAEAPARARACRALPPRGCGAARLECRIFIPFPNTCNFSPGEEVCVWGTCVPGRLSLKAEAQRWLACAFQRLFLGRGGERVCRRMAGEQGASQTSLEDIYQASDSCSLLYVSVRGNPVCLKTLIPAVELIVSHQPHLTCVLEGVWMHAIPRKPAGIKRRGISLDD
ncbi:uncharacterized protein LOC121232543 [Aquila chrysaetos chrysaetos]|uniref:uncharacterized protein LOC121232543 n=1 Tax=Aquila chrysaetos chrysaetos TaxID=223781 RepID=UPI001B7D37D6|nr:uncharacterized protein LOC121232543 [Aquila chrysaetos chrysaetos]